jgi:hypothetical protein
MNRARSVLGTALTLTILSSVASIAHAQVGWAHFHTRIGGSTDTFRDLGVSHTFVQGPNGLEETFTAEFTPGSHTLARIDAALSDCRASADNVTFTITAGRWTEVDVPVTLRDCKMNIALLPLGAVASNGSGDGVGTVNFTIFPSIGAPISVASCTIVEGGPALYQWQNFHGCHGVAPYGSKVMVTATAGHNSLSGYGPDSTLADTLDAYDGFGFAFFDTTSPHPDGVSLKTDLGITLVGGSAQGFVSNSIFRIVNHGPNNAYRVGVLVNAIASENANVEESTSIVDGSCGGSSCSLLMLPAGDSTTVNVRLETIPDPEPDTPADSFPSANVTCTTVTVSNQLASESGPPDPNASNNTAACISTAVPVTVALGGSTPPSHTVAAGASDVPMIEFLVTPASQQTITGVTVQASGTGNEQTDVTAVKLYIDKNSNGAVDAGDSVVATGTFAANDGTVTLAVNPGLVITTPTALMVTYSFSVTVAERLGGAIVLAFLPLFLIPATRKRKTLLAMLLVMITSVAVASCGGDSSTGPKKNNGSVTFQSTLTGVSTTVGSVANLTVAGATITIDK